MFLLYEFKFKISKVAETCKIYIAFEEDFEVIILINKTLWKFLYVLSCALFWILSLLTTFFPDVDEHVARRNPSRGNTWCQITLQPMYITSLSSRDISYVLWYVVSFLIFNNNFYFVPLPSEFFLFSFHLVMLILIVVISHIYATTLFRPCVSLLFITAIYTL